MARSLKKGAFIDPSLEKKVDKIVNGGEKKRPIKT